MFSSVFAFFFPLLLYSYILFLHIFLPARSVAGYVTSPSSGLPLRYRLNGLLVQSTVIASAFSVVAAIAILIDANLATAAATILYVEQRSVTAGACVLGLLASFVVVFMCPKYVQQQEQERKKKHDNDVPAPPQGSTLLSQFYLGILSNPQFTIASVLVDSKIALYLFGAVLLELNLLSALCAHTFLFAQTGAFNYGVLVHTLLFSFFVHEYLFFERVHLYTYDFFAENVGFKLTWGCMCFYPQFYPIGIMATAHVSKDTNTITLLVATIMFFAGWTLARGANMQKYYFKLDRSAPYFLSFVSRYVSSSDSKNSKYALIVSGFWGLSRHINYLGEILMASGLTLSLGVFSWLSLLYPVYYVLLFVPRQSDDDARCAVKYGKLWDEYCKQVPYRIVPGLY